MVEAQAAAQPDTDRVGTGNREGGMEDHSAQPTASPIPHKPVELPLWHNPDPLSDLHVVGSNRASARFVLVFVFGNAGATRAEPGPGQDASPSY